MYIILYYPIQLPYNHHTIPGFHHHQLATARFTATASAMSFKVPCNQDD